MMMPGSSKQQLLLLTAALVIFNCACFHLATRPGSWLFQLLDDGDGSGGAFPAGEHRNMQQQDGSAVSRWTCQKQVCRQEKRWRLIPELQQVELRGLHDMQRVCGGGEDEAEQVVVREEEWMLQCSKVWRNCTQTQLKVVCWDMEFHDQEYAASAPLEGGVWSGRYGDTVAALLLFSKVRSNSYGQIFDGNKTYVTGGCGKMRPSPTEETGRLQEMDVVINLASGYDNYYHSLVEALPRWVTVLPALESMPGVPVVVGSSNVRFLSMLQLVGISVSSLNLSYVGKGSMVAANTMIVPSSPPCAHSSKAVWDVIRRRHFGLGKVGRSVFQELPGWRLVLGIRHASRSIVQSDELLAGLRSWLGRERVRTFSDDRLWSFHQTSLLFSKCAIYVAPHGAGLSNMVFMPHSSFIVEVRPAQFSNPCYHALADALGFTYHLLHSPGQKHSNLTVHVPSVLHLLASIVNPRMNGSTLSTYST